MPGVWPLCAETLRTVVCSIPLLVVGLDGAWITTCQPEPVGPRSNTIMTRRSRGHCDGHARAVVVQTWTWVRRMTDWGALRRTLVCAGIRLVRTRLDAASQSQGPTSMHWMTGGDAERDVGRRVGVRRPGDTEFKYALRARASWTGVDRSLRPASEASGLTVQRAPRCRDADGGRRSGWHVAVCHPRRYDIHTSSDPLHTTYTVRRCIPARLPTPHADRSHVCRIGRESETVLVRSVTREDPPDRRRPRTTLTRSWSAETRADGMDGSEPGRVSPDAPTRPSFRWRV